MNLFVQKINIYKNEVPLTTIKMVQGGPKNGGLVQITTPEHRELVRHCLTLPLQLLCLAGTLSLITMLCLHVGFHGTHASCSKTICLTGQANLIMFADMVVEGFVVSGPECTQRDRSLHPPNRLLAASSPSLRHCWSAGPIGPSSPGAQSCLGHCMLRRCCSHTGIPALFGRWPLSQCTVPGILLLIS